ncbi:hypothetical protein K438DRAFT_1768100 [Mycena galopus ATCC 62051]|nr:hypothetical protein K438DRAFT_1768100 [Mycena galopus ATCC 62051]
MAEWNRDVRITLQDDKHMDLTPDFAFGEKSPPKPKYRIVFECAWGQPDADLNTKMEDWFQLYKTPRKRPLLSRLPRTRLVPLRRRTRVVGHLNVYGSGQELLGT